MTAKDFGALALPLLDALHRTARRLTGSAADADDLVQETYLEAFRSSATLRDRARARAWLFAVLRNVWRQQQRRRGGVALVELNALEEELTALVDTAEAVLVATALTEDLGGALRSLPEELRLVLLLADVEGLAYDEIATVLECPIGTVRSRLSRARHLMLARLERWRRAAVAGRS